MDHLVKPGFLQKTWTMEREKIIYIFFYLLKNIRRFERLQYQRKGKSRNGRPTFGAYFLLNKITIFKLEGEFEKLSSSELSTKIEVLGCKNKGTLVKTNFNGFESQLHRYTKS